MPIKLLAISLLLAPGLARAQGSAEWVTTTVTAPWQTRPALRATAAPAGPADVTIDLARPAQTITGFGACFNELGWTSLSLLPAADRDKVFRELFAPGVGASFTICRMPVGANDFSRDWYSYDETPGDFAMQHFSIANDRETLIPFIRQAQRQYPALRLWASPWSPPTWMKRNQHYAAAAVLPEYRKAFPTLADNGLAPDKQGQEGHDLFIQEDKYFAAYALYFAKFIEAYRQEGITVGMVMPQNEFNSAQVFPSCPWTATGLARFVGYLGPQMQKLKTDVFFGTMERANEALVDTVLRDPRSAPYVHGVGFQWAGKGAIAGIHRRYPSLALYQSEQECGDGQNDWKYCRYTWSLMRHYLSSGANAYLYWNIALRQGGLSRWGWRQNSLLTVDEASRTYRWTPEYYLLKHLSHYVLTGAKRLTTSGQFDNVLAFQNPDKSIILVAQNPDAAPRTVAIRVGQRVLTPRLPADSFSTLVLR
ncbi:glycoside hydrolase family 30 protein [Hymenobacter cheonanensis]|uniref:glycoside hydrolase family 30 protein n=1 Tax=Hymenobacter sp. CA2-7 TaxID=3063993 RepID=UPI002713E5DD|nr:glycoside hydrolase family 30 beta sandwich domain-containing protein [Hymenobacter sp. CA2-7]MDO7886454.1 glycoside hydrolase family 30 beta sandwich domain-containing protein [Hymenobacter sp. CA2-7]